MPLFPDGRPTDLLGELSLLPTTGADAGTDDNSDAESDNSSKSGARKAASVVQPRVCDAPFELAAGPRQLRKLRGAATSCKSKRAWGEPKLAWV